MKYLLFRLYAPMCSWGDIAVGEIRPCFTHPSKSAVLGLVAGALGIRRTEEDKHRALSDAIGFAVLLESMGIPLSDYHTAQVPSGRELYCTRRDELSGERSDLNTILSKRDYRSDALYTIVLWERARCDWGLSRIKDKLEQPEFVPFLGRKACPPALPYEAQIIDAVSINEAIGKVKFMDIQKLGFKSNGQRILYWDSDAEAGVEPQHIFERRDAPLSRARWQFDMRTEKYAVLA